jgi:transcriptional regulator
LALAAQVVLALEIGALTEAIAFLVQSHRQAVAAVDKAAAAQAKQVARAAAAQQSIQAPIWVALPLHQDKETRAAMAQT